MKPILFLLMGLFLFLLSPALAAQEIDEQAQAAFDRGKKAFADGSFIESADNFREAYRLKPTWKLLYNIGQAEAAGKRYGLALDTFEQYLAEGGDEIKSDRQEAIQKEIKRLQGMVGYLGGERTRWLNRGCKRS